MARKDLSRRLDELELKKQCIDKPWLARVPPDVRRQGPEAIDRWVKENRIYTKPIYLPPRRDGT